MYSIRIAPVPIVATFIKEGRVSSASVSTTCTVSGWVATYVGTVMITATNKKAITASATRRFRLPPQVELLCFHTESIVLVLLFVFNGFSKFVITGIVF